MEHMKKNFFIPVQRCYPDEYRNYNRVFSYLDECIIPVEVFRIQFSKPIEMVMYPNACCLLSFERDSGGEVSIRFIGRITETVCTHQRDDTFYFMLKFPPQFTFKLFAGEANQIKTLDSGLCGGEKAISAALQCDDINECFDTLISLIRESPLGLSFNGLIDAFVRECILTNQTYCVERIVQNLNYSARYVRSVIKRNLGISSKRLFDIMRLQNIMDSQIFDDGDSLNCVFENGFYDQTHLNKNIRKLTGLSYISFKSILKAKNS